MFNSLSHKFANLLVNNKIIEEEDFEIYRYGFETLIYFIVNIAIALFIGIIFDKFIHTIIFLSCYCTLRQFTGGYHARNYTECTLTFVVIYLITIFVDKNIEIDKYLLIVLLIFSIFIIYKLAPLDHRNKPLSKKEKDNYKSIAMKISIFISIIIILGLFIDYIKIYTIYYFFAIIWICILLVIGSINSFYCEK